MRDRGGKLGSTGGRHRGLHGSEVNDIIRSGAIKIAAVDRHGRTLETIGWRKGSDGRRLCQSCCGEQEKKTVEKNRSDRNAPISISNGKILHCGVVLRLSMVKIDFTGQPSQFSLPNYKY